jgi:hypothetical protein
MLQAPGVGCPHTGAEPPLGASAWYASKTEEVVMAMWNSSGSSPFAVRAFCIVASAPMKAPKLSASRFCSENIEPESSTTNRMSAVETESSRMRADPGWMMHFPTGLKL